MDFNFSFPFFQIDPPGNTTCIRLMNYNMSTRTTVIGIFIVGLGICNVALHSLLLSVIIYNWKTVFCHDFVYKLIINMNVMAIFYSFVTFAVISPCIISGCLSYRIEVVQIFSGSWRGMEYGCYFVVFFIALDRFFVFYFAHFGKYFRKFYTIIFLWLLTFIFQDIMYWVGCPKLFDLVHFSPYPCKNCLIFGASWNNITRTIIYNLPYPMFILYALIFIKVLMMRCKAYEASRKFARTDQILTIQFLILCGIQFLLSSAENYLFMIEMSNPSYWSIIRFSLPFSVHIINALMLLLSNRVVRKGVKQLITHTRNVSIKNFVTTIEPKANTTHLRRSSKWASSRIVLSTVIHNN